MCGWLSAEARVTAMPALNNGQRVRTRCFAPQGRFELSTGSLTAHRFGSVGTSSNRENPRLSRSKGRGVSAISVPRKWLTEIRTDAQDFTSFQLGAKVCQHCRNIHPVSYRYDTSAARSQAGKAAAKANRPTRSSRDEDAPEHFIPKAGRTLASLPTSGSPMFLSSAEPRERASSAAMDWAAVGGRGGRPLRGVAESESESAGGHAGCGPELSPRARR